MKISRKLNFYVKYSYTIDHVWKVVKVEKVLPPVLTFVMAT